MARTLTAAVHRKVTSTSRALEVDGASQGETIEEAHANMREALKLYFGDEEDVETHAPPPITAVVTSGGSSSIQRCLIWPATRWSRHSCIQHPWLAAP